MIFKINAEQKRATRMSNISRQRVGELQRGVFTILLDQPEGLPAKEVISRMAQVVPPTEFEKSDYPNHPGTQRFGKIIRFAPPAVPLYPLHLVPHAIATQQIGHNGGPRA